MMRSVELEMRRQALIMRCEAQRAELSWRLQQVVPPSLRGVAGSFVGGERRSRHPLAWLAALAGLMVFGRAREVLTFLVWTRSALNLVSRATQVVSLVGALRHRRKGRATVEER
jgi:hypothetical protein